MHLTGRTHNGNSRNYKCIIASKKRIDKLKKVCYNSIRCFVCAGVAQLAEQLICNQQVAGSSPITSSIILTWMGSRAAKGSRL